MKGRMRQILHALPKAATRNAGQPTLNLGGCAPPPPAPPFFGSPKKGGKESSPLATSQGLLPATRYALRTCQYTGVARVARTSPRPKALPPACSRQGQKTPRRPAPQKAPTPRTVIA